MDTKRDLRMTMLVLLCAVLAGGWSPTSARTIYVDDDAPAPGDGSSWATAFQYLPDALAVVQAGDEIRAAQGQYRPDQGLGRQRGDREAAFQLIHGVTMLGGFAGAAGADPDQRDPAGFPTILTGDLAGNDDPNDRSTWSDNSVHVVTAGAASNDAVLDGLTIAHGYADDEYEAALYNEGGSLVLRDCTFRDNGANNGDAGVCNLKGSLCIERCRFTHNWTEALASWLRNDRGSVQVIAAEFIENDCGFGTSGVVNDRGQAVLFGCLFRANRSAQGLGILGNEGEMSLLYCTFIDNAGLDSTATVVCGGGRARIANCLFAGNRGGYVGALGVGDASVSLQQCTFYGNIGWDYRGGGRAGAFWGPASSGAVTARGCIFWGNRNVHDAVTGYDAQISGDPNLVAVEYCCIEGWTPQRGGTGNIGADPLFVAPDQNDFHLKSQAGHWDAAARAWVLDDVTSPCIDAGDPNAPVEYEPFPNGGCVNMGAYGGTCEASKSWFGAEAAPGVEAADLNGDGRVDGEDFRLATRARREADQ